MYTQSFVLSFPPTTYCAPICVSRCLATHFNILVCLIPPRDLFDYVATRDLTSIKECIDADTSAVEGASDNMGFTPLHVACARGSIDICKALLGHAPPAAAATEDPLGSPKKMSKKSSGKESLSSSLRRGQMSETEMPIPFPIPAANCDVNARSAQGYTPLHVAAWHGHLSIVKLLLDSGADPLAMTEGFRLDEAGVQELTEYYLAKASTANTPPPVPMRFPRTAYQFARLHRYVDIERVLRPLTMVPEVGFNENTDVRDGKQDSVDHYCTTSSAIVAAEKGNLLFYSLALEDLINGGLVHPDRYAAGLEVLDRIRSELHTDTNANVLHTAVEGCTTAVGEQLLAMLLVPCIVVKKSGYPLEECLVSVFGPGPVHYPTESDYKEGRIPDVPVQQSSLRNASPPAQDDRPSTAPRNTDMSILGTTIGSKAGDFTSNTPTICTANTSNGLTALHYAVRVGRLDLVKLFLAMDADPSAEAKPVEGLTPRMAAGGTPVAMCAAGDVTIKNILTEAVSRNAFLDMYAQRNYVPPSERPDFSDAAKELKRQWRKAQAALL